MKLKKLMLAAFALGTLLLLPSATHADPLLFDNSPPVVVAGQGSATMFSITIRNSGPGTLTITGLDFGGFSRISDGMGNAGLVESEFGSSVPRDPPVTRTVPSGSSVALCSLRPPAIDPVYVH